MKNQNEDRGILDIMQGIFELFSKYRNYNKCIINTYYIHKVLITSI
jgi:hypothetical protein